jgi:hypothetical protein
MMDMSKLIAYSDSMAIINLGLNNLKGLFLCVSSGHKLNKFYLLHIKINYINLSTRQTML